MSVDKKLPIQKREPKAWTPVVDDVRKSTLRKALVDERGNISRAAETVGIHRSHAMRLLKLYDLVEFAADLRERAGGRRSEDGKVTGRPSFDVTGKSVSK